MPDKMPKCKITIIKKTLNTDFNDEYLIQDYMGIDKCKCFKEDQEFLIDPNLGNVPKGFCDWAWADIRNNINSDASGGNIIGFKKKVIVISACSDWFRLGYFRIERID
jgi:uncharacterized repeat protein (TIGR04076 family)